MDRRPVIRKDSQKREVFRLNYPSGHAPQVLSKQFQLVGLSQKAIKLACEKDSFDDLQLNGPIELTLSFDDGQTLTIHGRISRFYHDQNSKEVSFVCIPNERICFKDVNHQQRFLLRNFPHFCRDNFKRQAEHLRKEYEHALSTV